LIKEFEVSAEHIAQKAAELMKLKKKKLAGRPQKAPKRTRRRAKR
jgi:hypothetical protein